MSEDLVQLPKRSRLPETPRLVLTLALAGLLSGLAIVGAYRLTLPTIEANNAQALREAVFKVLPGAERLQRLVWKDGHMVPAEGASADEPSVYAGYTADGKFVGYAIPAAGAGFQDTIRLIYGFDPAKERIVGMEVLESRETPGLGDRIYDDEHFHHQFLDLAVKPTVELVKHEPTAPNQVDAITGATISSTAVVKIVNSGNQEWLSRLPKAGAAPPLAPEGKKPPVPTALPQRGGPIPGGKQ
jgi:electron transport complex protein RnfG